MKRIIAIICGILVFLLLATMFWPRTVSEPSSGGVRREAGPDPWEISDLDSDLLEEEEYEGRRLSLEDLVQWGEEGNVPIAFYGRVVDENGEPLQGVEILTEVSSFSAAAFRAGENYQNRDPHIVESDAAGDFSITGTRGTSVTVRRFEKEGYRVLPTQQISFSFDPAVASNYQSDPANPVVFTMWRERGGEAGVVDYRRRGRIPSDGTEAFFDLEKGRLNKGHRDLRITLLRDPLEIEHRQNFDWILRVEAIGGGVSLIEGPPGLEAPESGYAPFLDLVMMADDPDWDEYGKMIFYVKARNGQLYGRVQLSVMADAERLTTGITIIALVNPNGSRVLESLPPRPFKAHVPAANP